MPKIMQNLVVLMEPSEDAWQTPLKGGNMILNRFGIDEDAAFELSGVDYLTKLSWMSGKSRELEVERKVKGKDYSFLRSETFFIQFAELYLHKQFIIIPQKSILIRTLIILHNEKIMIMSTKTLKYTLFMHVIMVLIIYIVNANWDQLF